MPGSPKQKSKKSSKKNGGKGGWGKAGQIYDDGEAASDRWGPIGSIGDVETPVEQAVETITETKKQTKKAKA